MSEPTKIPIRMGTFFALNIPDLVLSEMDAPIQVSVHIGSSAIAYGITLTPDKDKKITIRNSQFARAIKTFAAPDISYAIFPTLDLHIYFQDGTDREYSYTVIPGGVAAKENTEEILASGFLTRHPQQVITTPEQPQWLVAVKAAKYYNLDIASSLTATNGQTYTKTIRESAGTDYDQIPVGFHDIWSTFCQEKGLSPVAYDVFGIATLRDGTIEQHRPYPQRYILRAPRHGDTCFGFANTLGGFDTFMASGKIVLKPEGEIQTFVNNQKEVELYNGYTPFWEASTGYIDTEGMANLIQDFFKSRSRWIFDGSTWRRIIVDEYKIAHTPLELNAYTFKYHLAEKGEHRLFQRHELPEVELPTQYFKHDDVSI